MRIVMNWLGLLRRIGQKAGPYLMLEMLLPGGTLLALLLFLLVLLSDLLLLVLVLLLLPLLVLLLLLFPFLLLLLLLFLFFVLLLLFLLRLLPGVGRGGHSHQRHRADDNRHHGPVRDFTFHCLPL